MTFSLSQTGLFLATADTLVLKAGINGSGYGVAVNDVFRLAGATVDLGEGDEVRLLANRDPTVLGDVNTRLYNYTVGRPACAAADPGTAADPGATQATPGAPIDIVHDLPAADDLMDVVQVQAPASKRRRIGKGAAPTTPTIDATIDVTTTTTGIRNGTPATSSAPPPASAVMSTTSTALDTCDGCNNPKQDCSCCIPEDMTCPICLGLFALPVTLFCGHTMCMTCANGVRDHTGPTKCTVI